MGESLYVVGDNDRETATGGREVISAFLGQHFLTFGSWDSSTCFIDAISEWWWLG